MPSKKMEQFPQALVQLAPDAIIYADAEGIIRFWNAGAERVFGFTAREAAGRSLDLIIPENLRARHWAGYREVMLTGTSRYAADRLLAVPAIRKDGKRISVEFTLVPIKNDNGVMRGLGAIIRDVTERYEEMKRLKERAKGKPGEA
ncbi:MAG: PAS domain S-box protein [Alphaproteobacteria bacterium]|nr:PAS domain S-box protein [Alphaproteobacteria bacterium]